jgi:hypothetical protein
MTHSITTLGHYAQCHYAECRYAECRYAECRYAECRYAKCRGAKQNQLKIISVSDKFLKMTNLFFNIIMPMNLIFIFIQTNLHNKILLHA